MKKFIPIIIVIFVALALSMVLLFSKENVLAVRNFEECVMAGNPVMESYPRQCSHKGQNFIENIDSVVCTADAKLCADGSYVGRTGPNCEFASCPGNGEPIVY